VAPVILWSMTVVEKQALPIIRAFQAIDCGPDVWFYKSSIIETQTCPLFVYY
jgi:hypothetical protein